MDWRTILILTHVLGTILGVGGVTFAFLFSRKALADGKVDASEGAFLHTTFVMLRTGLILILVSGFGIFLYYRLNGRIESLYNVRFWLKMTFTAVIAFNTILFALRRMPSWLAHGISITSWYAAFILGVWRGYHWPYYIGVIWYVFLCLLVGAIIRGTEIHKKMPL